jgi:hypothetical protein
MRRRGKNTKTLGNISREMHKGSSSNLLPDSTRRPRRYIWSQLFLSGHSDLLIVNLRLRVSVGFSPTSPKRKQKLQPNFGCFMNLSAIQMGLGNTLVTGRSRCPLLGWRQLVCVGQFALPRSTRKSVPICRYEEVKPFSNPGSRRVPHEPSKSSKKQVDLHVQQDRDRQVPTGWWLIAPHGPDLGFHLVLRQSEILGIYPLKGYI